jgi:hypothetical protein
MALPSLLAPSKDALSPTPNDAYPQLNLSFANNGILVSAANEAGYKQNHRAFGGFELVARRRFDRGLADRKDAVASECERVVIGLESFEAYFDSIPQSFFEGLHPQLF